MAKRVNTVADTLVKQAEIVEKQRVAAEKALLSGKAKEYESAKTKLKEVVDEYNLLARRVEYTRMKTEPLPFVAFAKTVTYKAKKVNETRNKVTKELDGVEVQTTERRLNLREFIDYAEIESKMINNIAKLQATLIVREKKILELTPEVFAKESGLVVDVVRAKSEGKTPDSNTAICKLIQSIADEAGIECKIINPDMYFIHTCAFVHDSKGIARVKPVTDGKFVSIIVDLFAHFVQGIPYSILIKEQKNADKAA